MILIKQLIMKKSKKEKRNDGNSSRLKKVFKVCKHW